MISEAVSWAMNPIGDLPNTELLGTTYNPKLDWVGDTEVVKGSKCHIEVLDNTAISYAWYMVGHGSVYGTDRILEYTITSSKFGKWYCVATYEDGSTMETDFINITEVK